MTESDAVSVRIYRNSKPGQHNFQADHDMRVGKVPTYVDRSRIHDNSVIIPTISEDDARALCQEKRAKRETKRAMKKGTTVTVAGIITFGREAQKQIKILDRETQDDAYLEIAKACADFLKTTLVGVSAHRDEYAPHAHFTILAYNDDGFPLSETVKKRHTSKLQDIAADVLQEQFGLDIKRGKHLGQRIADGDDWSKTHHRTVKQLQQDAPRELAALEEKIDAKLAECEFLDHLANEKAAKLEQQENEIKENAEKIKQGYIEIDLIKNLKAEEKADFEKYQRYITNTKENDKLDEAKRKKRMQAYENRMQNAIDNFAKLHEAPPDKVREALENAGLINKQEVMFAGPEEDDVQEITGVIQDIDFIT